LNTRSITVRLDSMILDKIDSKCNTDGCFRSDFIKQAIEDSLKEKPKPVTDWTMYDDYGNVIARSKPENSYLIVQLNFCKSIQSIHQ